MFSCRNEKPNTTLDKKYSLDLKIKAPLKYYYNISNETETIFEVNDKKFDNKNNSDIGMKYEMQPADSNGNIVIKITFDKFHTIIKNQDNETDIDADNAANSENPVEKFIGGIKGSSVEVTINKKGEVSSERGIKELTDNLINRMDMPDAASRFQLQKQVSAIMGGSFIKTNVEIGFKMLPDTPVFAGDTWKKKNIQELSGLKLNAITNYTLTSITDGLASIESTGEINSTGDLNTNIMGGYKIESDIKGKQEGYFEVEVNTGLLLKEESATSIKGEMDILGKSVPLTIKIKRKVEGKKL